MVNMEVEVLQSDNATKKSVMMNMLSQRISILKKITQDAYNAFINLQSIEQMCKELVGWLDPIYQQWGPYMQFFDRLIPLLAKKPNLPNKVIAVKEGMDKVKALLQFFIGKLAVIQNKMIILTNGFYSLILSILDSSNQVRDLSEWSNSFDHMVDFQQLASIFEGYIDECAFNELIDTLFKIETKMNRFITEGKVIIDVRWQKTIGELTSIKAYEWPTKREVIVWEAIVEIKDLLIGDG